jgi:hypothetical protein
MAAPSWGSEVAQTRVDIRALPLAVVHRTAWQRPWVTASADPAAPSAKGYLLQSRTATPASLSAALRARLRTAAGTARNTVRKRSRLTLAVAATAAAGAIAATGTAAPWAAAASSTAASGHAVVGNGNTASASGHGTRITLTDLMAAKPVVPGHPAALHAAAKPAAARPAAAKSAEPAKPYKIYDSVTPSSIPTGKAAAVYSNGAYQASTASVSGRPSVVWIDTNGSNTSANALDVEPGDATPAGAAAWVQAKLTKNPNQDAIVYTFKSDWGQVISNVNALPGWMHSHVKYWIADPTGTEHVLPGSTATQWYWGPNYDISTANPGFHTS